MPSQVQEKRPDERIRLSADFSHVLQAGEVIIGGEETVTAVVALTDAAATGLLDTIGLSNANRTIDCRFSNGTEGVTYRVTFDTGDTTAGNRFQAELHVRVTNTPAVETLLVTREQLRTRLRVGSTDTSDDDLFDQIVRHVSSYLRWRTGRDLDLRRYVEVLRLDCSDTVLTVREFPLERVEQIVTRSADGQDVTTTTTGISFARDGRVWLTDGSSFIRSPYEHEVTYRAGFIIIPEELVEAGLQLSAWIYGSVGREGLTIERIGNYMYERAPLTQLPARLLAELPIPMVEGAIARHRREELL